MGSTKKRKADSSVEEAEPKKRPENLRQNPKPNPKYGGDSSAAHLAVSVKEPQTYEEAIASPEADEWKDAMRREMESHMINKTWALVKKKPGEKVLGNRWIFKLKKNPDGSIEKFKARLVVRGFRQTEGVDYGETFSTVCRYESVRTLMSIAAAKAMCVRQFDIKTAFLYGEVKEKNLFMRQPSGFATENGDYVCWIKKSLYGLKQAPRVWYETFRAVMEKLGLYPSVSDPSVYVGKISGQTIYIAMFVDDGLCLSEDPEVVDYVIRKPNGFSGSKVQLY